MSLSPRLPTHCGTIEPRLLAQLGPPGVGWGPGCCPGGLLRCGFPGVLRRLVVGRVGRGHLSVVRVRQLQLLRQNTADWAASTVSIHCSHLWRPAAWSRGRDGRALLRALRGVCSPAVPLLCPRGAGADRLSVSLLTRHWLCPRDLITPRAPPPNTIPLGLRLQHRNSGEHRYSAHSKGYPLALTGSHRGLGGERSGGRVVIMTRMPPLAMWVCLGVNGDPLRLSTAFPDAQLVRSSQKHPSNHGSAWICSCPVIRVVAGGCPPTGQQPLQC